MIRGTVTGLTRILLLLGFGFALAACDRVSLPGGSGAASDTTLVGRLTHAPGGARVHLVRMVVRGDTAAFVPGRVTVGDGDVVRFVLDSQRPESVTFDVDGLSPDAAEFVRSQGLRHGELLTGEGQVYDVSFRGAPPGRYPFRSVPHAERGMRGEVVVPD